MEIECRQQEEDVAVDIDWETASQKSMAKVVNQVCACCDALGGLAEAFGVSLQCVVLCEA